jgi:hypothetical protein
MLLFIICAAARIACFIFKLFFKKKHSILGLFLLARTGSDNDDDDDDDDYVNVRELKRAIELIIIFCNKKK